MYMTVFILSRLELKSKVQLSSDLAQPMEKVLVVGPECSATAASLLCRRRSRRSRRASRVCASQVSFFLFFVFHLALANTVRASAFLCCIIIYQGVLSP